MVFLLIPFNHCSWIIPTGFCWLTEHKKRQKNKQTNKLIFFCAWMNCVGLLKKKKRMRMSASQMFFIVLLSRWAKSRISKSHWVSEAQLQMPALLISLSSADSTMLLYVHPLRSDYVINSGLCCVYWMFICHFIPACATENSGNGWFIVNDI